MSSSSLVDSSQLWDKYFVVQVPIVLVGSKSDMHRKRRVSAYEGQTLAKHIGCPFIEISARNNDCVNEVIY